MYASSFGEMFSPPILNAYKNNTPLAINHPYAWSKKTHFKII